MSGYRDDLGAAKARIAQLEEELEQVEHAKPYATPQTFGARHPNNPVRDASPLRWVSLPLGVVAIPLNLLASFAGLSQLVVENATANHIATGSLAAALVVGAVGVVVGVLAIRSTMRGRRAVAVVGLVVSAANVLCSVSAGIVAMTYLELGKDRVEHDTALRSSRELELPVVTTGTPVELTVNGLSTDWQADRIATDARYAGAVVALTGTFSLDREFDNYGAAYLFPMGHTEIHPYLAPSEVKRMPVSSSLAIQTETLTLLCLYHGSETQPAGSPRPEPELHLYGCVRRR
jgi:hypothetical protein